jgi:hypothetical protein
MMKDITLSHYSKYIRLLTFRSCIAGEEDDGSAYQEREMKDLDTRSHGPPAMQDLVSRYS